MVILRYFQWLAKNRRFSNYGQKKTYIIQHKKVFINTLEKLVSFKISNS